MINTAIIGIGSNIDPEKNIRKVLDILAREQLVITTSSLIRTPPVGITSQPDFLNGAVMIKTDLQHGALVRYLKQIEDQLGRDRSLPKYGPRTIDLDIVVWNGKVVDNDYHRRDFLKRVVDEIM